MATRRNPDARNRPMPEPPAATYPDLPPMRRNSFLGYFAFFGPGAIIASVTVGSGETVFASRGGAIFGYTLLWCFVFSAVFKAVQVYAGARYMTLTGRHPLESWAQLPGPRGWFVWMLAALTIVWMPFWLGGGLPKMLGDFANFAFGIKSWVQVHTQQHLAGLSEPQLAELARQHLDSTSALSQAQRVELLGDRLVAASFSRSHAGGRRCSSSSA